VTLKQHTYGTIPDRDRETQTTYIAKSGDLVRSDHAEWWAPMPLPDPYCDLYAVSTLGRVARLDAHVDHELRWAEHHDGLFGPVRWVEYSLGMNPRARVLKPYVTSKGYRAICISANGVKKNVLIYRLVARAFHGPKPSDNFVVAHCNGDALDDTAGNLQWKTYAENSQDMIDHGRSLRGTKQHNSKNTEQDVIEIREREGMIGCRALGRELGLAHTTILRIWSRERWAWLE